MLVSAPEHTLPIPVRVAMMTRREARRAKKQIQPENRMGAGVERIANND